MTRAVAVALALLLGLAACGLKGDPQKPAPEKRPETAAAKAAATP